MFKIASCILVAVCFNFQQVVVADSPSPAGLLRSWGSWGLDNVQDKISNVQDELWDSVGDVLGAGDRVIKKIGDVSDKITDSVGSRLSTEMQKLKDKTENFLRDSQNADGSSCSNLLATGRDAFLDLFNIFGKCVLGKAKGLGEDVRDLVLIITQLLGTLPKTVQETIQCYKENDIFTCIPKMFVSILSAFKPFGTIKQVIKIFLQFNTFAPTMKMCFMMSVAQFLPKYALKFVKDGGICVQSIIKGFIS